MAKGRNLKENIVRALEIPEDLAFRDTIITLTGTGGAVIENYRRILSYRDDEIIVTGFHGKIVISGKKLEIPFYTPEEMTVTGVIREVNMEN